MKKVVFIILSLSLLMASSAFSIDAAGSAFGNLSTAASLPQGAGSLGGGIGIGDNGTSFFGNFSYGMSQYTDLDLKLGIFDPDYANSDAGLVFGADFKYQFMSVSDKGNNPLDLAAGGLFEYYNGDFWSVLQFGGMLLGSYPVKMNNGRLLTPYGRINVRLESYDPEYGDGETELKFGLNGGVAFEVTELFTLYGEFQLDGNDGLFLGLKYRIL